MKLGAGRTALWLLLSANAALSADALPPLSDYLGEIRRDASGQLVVVPKAATPDRLSAPSGRVIQVGPGRSHASIATVAALAQDGDTLEIAAGDYIGDVAVWKQNNLTLRAVGGRARLIAAGASAENKAIWVMRGGRITVENIEFSGVRTPDKKGAGIRLESGHLVIRNCRFTDNENGILTDGGNGELDIENCEFGHNGAGDGYSHNLYVGALRKLRVVGSYFHHAKAGHLLKSRAAENHILYNRLTDESDGRASYELEFPNGGLAYVIGNLIEQSDATENPNLISYGAEGYKHPANGLYLINNTLVDKLPQSGAFLAVRPGFQVVKAWNNLLLGKRPMNAEGIDGEFVNNPNVSKESFVLADRHDYRIRRESPLHRTYRMPGTASDVSLEPDREYVHPAATRPLTGTPTLPGARQTLEPDRQ